MMSTICPVEVCSTAVVIGMDEFVDYNLIDFILESQMITAYNDLKHTSI